MPTLRTPSPAADEQDLSEQTFRSFRDLIYQHTGIVLTESKRSLLKARMIRRMRQLKIVDYDSYFRHICADQSGSELQEMTDAISTNVTQFYRERHHFSFLRQQIPVWTESGITKLRAWSAACSTGEEPYTLGIELLESIGRNPVDIRILATDISKKVLLQTQLGRYRAKDIEVIPGALRGKYFQPVAGETGDVFEAAAPLRRLLTIRHFNLTNFPYQLSGPLDLIFCRNVMIYFDRTTRQRMLNEFERLLRPGGFLMVGHSESLNGYAVDFKPVHPSIYLRT